MLCIQRFILSVKKGFFFFRSSNSYNSILKVFLSCICIATFTLHVKGKRLIGLCFTTLSVLFCGGQLAVVEDAGVPEKTDNLSQRLKSNSPVTCGIPTHNLSVYRPVIVTFDNLDHSTTEV